jgi:hypothetical protein
MIFGFLVVITGWPNAASCPVAVTLSSPTETIH